jgi:hypothetical protein
LDAGRFAERAGVASSVCISITELTSFSKRKPLLVALLVLLFSAFFENDHAKDGVLRLKATIKAAAQDEVFFINYSELN